MSKQIAISEQLYDILNSRRMFKGRKYSFNTIIMAMVKETIIAGSPEALFQHLQWRHIVRLLKQLEDDGWITNYQPHYAHILRYLFAGEYRMARELLEEQLPDQHTPPDPPSPSK